MAAAHDVPRGWRQVLADAGDYAAFAGRALVELIRPPFEFGETLRQLVELTVDYEQHRDATVFMAQLSSLLRRTMLAYAPRTCMQGPPPSQEMAWGAAWP